MKWEQNFYFIAWGVHSTTVQNIEQDWEEIAEYQGKRWTKGRYIVWEPYLVWDLFKNFQSLQKVFHSSIEINNTNHRK